MIRLHVWGDYGCFTRPEFKVERVSYDVITPAAARGILDAIYWQPEIIWVIDKIYIFKPIQYHLIRRNEINSKVSLSKARRIMERNDTLEGLYIAVDNNRQQRSTIALYSIAYIIEAHFDMTSHAGSNDNAAKHQSMFKRRAMKGQCFQQPSFGCREFVANFRLHDGAVPQANLPPDQLNKHLGRMLYDISFQDGDYQASFYDCKIENGVIDVALSRLAGDIA